MVPLLGIPLVQRQLRTFNSAGISDIVIVAGYKADELKVLNIPIVINERFESTNMVYTLFCAKDYIKRGEDLIISYGDIVFERRVLSGLLSSKAALSVVVDRSWLKLWSERMTNPLDDAETLKLDGDKITELGKKPGNLSDIQGQYIGLIKISAKYIDEFILSWSTMDRNVMYDGKDFNNMYMTSFIQHLIDSGWDTRATFTDSGWLEVDTVEDLQCYELMAKTGKLGTFYNHEE